MVSLLFAATSSAEGQPFVYVVVGLGQPFLTDMALLQSKSTCTGGAVHQSVHADYCVLMASMS